MKNPKWNRDEHILALDLYFRCPEARNNKKHPELFELSKILRSLPFHDVRSLPKNFRDPISICMKLNNFKRFDPSVKGVGLPRGAKLEVIVWNEFADDRESLASIAQAIRQNLESEPSVVQINPEDEDAIATEGALLTSIHQYRERNTKIVQAKKDRVLQAKGKLECEACGFDFFKKYGSRGEGFAECHHKLPLSTLDSKRNTKLEDLAVLCANCHRMIHRSRPWLSIDELKELLKDSF